MAEHGDMFGEHGRFMRGGPLRGSFYDPVLNFPLLIKHPRVKELIRTDVLTQTVDLFPTLFEMLRINDPNIDLRQGKSVLSGITGGEEPNEYVYAGSLYRAEKNNEFFQGISTVEMIRNKEWKLLREEVRDTDSNEKISETYELYRVSDDSKEERDLFSAEPEVFAALREKLDTWTRTIKTQQQ